MSLCQSIESKVWTLHETRTTSEELLTLQCLQLCVCGRENLGRSTTHSESTKNCGLSRVDLVIWTLRYKSGYSMKVKYVLNRNYISPTTIETTEENPKYWN